MALPNNTPRPVLALVGAALAALLALGGCGGKSETRSSEGRQVRGTTTAASRQPVPLLVTASGSLQAEKTVLVSTRMMGWVRNIHVTEGQTVAKGDLLVSIDDTDLQAKKRQAEAGITEARAVLANAERMAARFERLYDDKSVSKAQFDDVLTGRDRAAAGVAMAEAGLAELQVHLGYLAITAPTKGTVARKMIEEGDMANPGMPLVILELNERMKVVAHIGEKDVARIKAGDPATVDITSLEGAVFETVLDRVIQTANPGSRTYDIETHIENADSRLKSGMFARVSIPVGERPAVLVPAEAIIHRGQLTGVWVLDNAGQAHLRWIRLGHPRGSSFEVVSGMNGTETMVLSTEEPLVEGDRVVN